jgi:hypothetical protein
MNSDPAVVQMIVTSVKIDCARITDWASLHAVFAETFGFPVTLRLDHVRDFRRRCPEQYAALIECSAFVNWRAAE